MLIILHLIYGRFYQIVIKVFCDVADSHTGIASVPGDIGDQKVYALSFTDPGR